MFYGMGVARKGGSSELVFFVDVWRLPAVEDHLVRAAAAFEAVFARVFEVFARDEALGGVGHGGYHEHVAAGGADLGLEVSV